MTNKATSFNFFSRLKASGVHLFFSSLIFIAVMYLIRYIWYPGPHFLINGGIEGTKILVLVDLVLGPLITFIIWNTRKAHKEQNRDIAIILSIQVAMLAYGVFNIYSQRPVIATLTFDGAYRTALEEDMQWGDFISRDDVTAMSEENPPLVFLREPQTDDEKGGFAAYMFMSKAGMSGATFLYEEMNSPVAQEALENMLELSVQFIESNEFTKNELSKFKEKHPNAKYYFPFYARSGKAIVALDKQGKIIDYFAVERLPVEPSD